MGKPSRNLPRRLFSFLEGLGSITKNQLFYGDNLDVLPRHIDDESVDLIYLDPPFNSKQDYNILFAEQDGSRAAAQIKAFGDTWRWDQGAEAACVEIIEKGGRPSVAIQALRQLLGTNDMMAYIAMMAPRLVELRRVLKATGSIYLHCDPTASHYLKVLMDAIFGPTQFRNEIVWKRADPKGHAFSRFPTSNDSILFYAKGEFSTWNQAHKEYDQSYLDKHYASIDEGTGRRFTLSDCTNPNKNRPNLTYDWKGITKVWRWTKERMQKNHDEGRLVYTKSGAPRYKRFLDEMLGTHVTTVWTDIPFINSQAAERLGYPTQKPQALLERIIKASSNEGDVILDAFCGCGTAIAAAQHLNRRWIGIDITHLAISLIKHRLHDAFGASIDKTYTTVGEPTSLPDAQDLADHDPYQFQWWALGLVHARPVDEKKGADKGVDGRLFFHESDATKTKQIIFSVKAGHTGPAHIRDLAHVVDRENAAMGVLIAMHDTTRPMRTAAAEAGVYESTWGQKKHPRIQILTIEELLAGKIIDAPPMRQIVTFKKAPKAKKDATHRQPKLDEFPEAG